MYLGSIIKKWKKDDCILIDAVAERSSVKRVIKRLKEYKPDILIFMAGIDSFGDDMQVITTIKEGLPSLKIASIGYIPTVFPKETLERIPAIDYIIMNEPELSFSEFYDCLKEKKCPKGIRGIAHEEDGAIIVEKERNRIKDLDAIPFPDRSLINMNFYSEFMLKKPFATMTTSRGCPYSCTFCIPTYGRETVYRSVENVAAEIEEAIHKYKVRTIRFMDDTFILNRERVAKLCDIILKRDFKFHWIALTRVGTLDEEIVRLMKRSGLKRIYLGIETRSQRLLDYYQKRYDANLIEGQVGLVKTNGIEVVGLFMVGGPQTEEELKEDIAMTRHSKLDYIAAATLTVYPGTKLYEEMKEDVKFTLIPYINTFKNNQLQEKTLKMAKVFYHDFYFNLGYLIKMFKFLFSDPKGLVIGAKRVAQFVFFYRGSQNRRRDFI